MAGINYSHSYTSSVERSFDRTYTGAISRDLKAFFTGGYEQQYTGYYTHAWEGSYIGYYGKIWSAAYTGYYTGYFTGYYQKAYVGNYTGQYTGTFAGQYTGYFTGYYEKAYTGYYTGYFTGYYEGQYTGQYTHAWTNNTAWQRAYAGVYAGNYQHGPWTGIYSHIWSGSRTYSGQYTGQYTHAYSHQWEGDFIGYYTGVYQGTYSGWYNVANWTGTYTSYGQAPANYTHVSYTQSTANYEKSYSGQYTGYFAGTNQYTGYFSVSDTYTGYYSNQVAWEGVGYFHSGGGEGGQQWSGAIQWIQSTGTNWVKTYMSVHYLFDGEPTVLPFNRNYQAPAPTGTAYSSTWTSLAYFETSYASLDLPFTQYGTAYYLSGSITPVPGNIPQFWDFAAYVGGYTGATTVYYTAQYLQSVARQWTGAANWSGLRTHYSSTQFSKTYEGNWTGVYGGQAYFVGYWDGTYAQNVEKFFDGASYTHVTEVTYTHLFTGYYEKIYEGTYAGNRTYNSNENQYQGDYTGYYGDYWQGTFTGYYQGPASYGSRTDGIGSFTDTYEGVYAKNYAHIWDQIFTGYYTHAWDGTYSNQFTGYYDGQRDHSFGRTRTVNYSHAWDQIFIGYYGNTYGKIYTHAWTGQYEKTYVGQYTKLYGGSWLGNTGVNYSGTIGNYTSSYSGTPSYEEVYAGNTTYLGLKTGEIVTDGQARIKSAGTWKAAEAVHIKSEGAWKESKAIYIKKQNQWVLSHIGYERTSVTLSADTQRFNLRDYLVSQGKSVSTRPQLVNITIDGCDVYSTNDSAALDVSTNLGAINLGSDSIKHRVRIVVLPDARIIGKSGAPGTQNGVTRTGNDATNGGPAIRTSPAIELYIENYGIIAGGGGGGGSGGYPVTGSTLNRVGGLGGYGAGYAMHLGSITNILENNSLINGSNSAVAYGIHGGSGGLLGQRGAAAGGFNHDNSSLNEANDGALKTQYDNSGNGGLPGAAIIGYDATRTTFINTGNVWGDSKYKLQA